MTEMACELQASSQKRMSYWDKMVVDEDIPYEDLHRLSVSSNHAFSFVNMYNHITPSNDHIMSPPSSSDFDNEAYVEYRRRVFAQLASEYDKEKKQQQNGSPNHVDSRQNVGDNSLNDEESHHTSWNGTNSDHTITNKSNVNHTLPKNRTCHVPAYKSAQTTKSENDLCSDRMRDCRPMMDWSSFEEKIKLIAEKSELKSPPSLHTSINSLHPSSRQWRGKKNLYHKQKMEREAIRHKLSFGSSEVGRDDVANRLERSFSTTNQSLQICYINASCSSSDSDDASPPSTPSLISPGFSPRVLRGVKRGRSSSSSPSSPFSNEHTIISHHRHKDRSKLQDMELEARCELARAHQRAKYEAEEERSGRDVSNSLIQKVLNGTLSEEISLKIKSFRLTKFDCRAMTFAQLQLIINDMNINKLVLNEELVALLIARDELKTKQDARLVDIDDVKTMLCGLGPETSV